MKSIFVYLLICFTLTASAQEKKKVHHYDKEKMEEWLPSMTLSLGGSFQDFRNFNSRLKNLPQYQQLRVYTPTLALGWFKERDRLISDVGITFGSSMGNWRKHKQSTVRYVGFNANAGYDVLNNEKITLYPLAGIGYQTYQAILYKDNSNVNFNDVLTSPVIQNSINNISFYNSFWVYRLGAGVLFTSSKHPQGSIGLQAGYTGSFQKRSWRTRDNQILRNTPRDGVSQFYIGVVFTHKPQKTMRK